MMEQSENAKQKYKTGDENLVLKDENLTTEFLNDEIILKIKFLKIMELNKCFFNP